VSPVVVRGQAVVPSVVSVDEQGALVVGKASSPERTCREFKRRFGDPTPIVLGGQPFSADFLTATVIADVVTAVSAAQGEGPDGIALTHPANWGGFKTDLLRQAVRHAGLDVVAYLSEPEAAARAFAATERLPEGALIAVYDLGGGTFDAAVVRVVAQGTSLIGTPEGIERLGGIDVDEAVFEHVRQAALATFEDLDPDDPTTLASIADLRQACVHAKETLSSATETVVSATLPSGPISVRLTRTELEAAIQRPLEQTVEALRRTLRGADVEPSDLHAVLLVGGSSRIPLVNQLVTSALGRPTIVTSDPKGGVAEGAARAATIAAARRRVPPPSIAASPPVSRPVNSSRGRRPAVPLVLIALALAALAGVAIALTRDHPKSPSAALATTSTTATTLTPTSTTDPTVWPPQAISDFVDLCAARGSDVPTCQCIITGFQTLMTFDRYVAVDGQLKADPNFPLPADMQHVVTGCQPPISS
jgi:molecular chaperone DnaK (HSP70)